MHSQITTKVEECFQIADKFFNKQFQRPQHIVFKRNGTRGGYSWWAKKELMFQLDFAESNPEDFLNSTVPHECAHYIQSQQFPGSKAHGREWQYIMSNCFKVPAKRCHNYDVSVTTTKRETRHIYGCSCGKEFKISTTIHNRIQQALQISQTVSNPQIL